MTKAQVQNYNQLKKIINSFNLRKIFQTWLDVLSHKSCMNNKIHKLLIKNDHYVIKSALNSWRENTLTINIQNKKVEKFIQNKERLIKH